MNVLRQSLRDFLYYTQISQHRGLCAAGDVPSIYQCSQSMGVVVRAATWTRKRFSNNYASRPRRYSLYHSDNRSYQDWLQGVTCSMRYVALGIITVWLFQALLLSSGRDIRAQLDLLEATQCHILPCGGGTLSDYVNQPPLTSSRADKCTSSLSRCSEDG